MKTSKQTLLWQISGLELPGTSYLFGTMHVRNQRAFAHLEVVYEAIEQCDAFATEVNLDGLGMMGALQTFQLPNGTTLDQLFAPKKYAKLRRILRKVYGIDIHAFRRLQPILIANLLEESTLMKDMPFALDQHLWQFAQERGKKMAGIETLDEQIQTLQSIPLDYQIQALLSIQKNISRHRKSLLKATDWYKNGRIDQLYRSSRQGLHGLRSLLLYNRNQLMATRIRDMVNMQTSFCAVGAAHLWGKYGVIRLLKNDQIKVTPVQLNYHPSN